MIEELGSKWEHDRLLDVSQVARMLNCSRRHVFRMSEAGRMPKPIKLGSLVRWSLFEMENWITEQCGNDGKAVR